MQHVTHCLGSDICKIITIIYKQHVSWCMITEDIYRYITVCKPLLEIQVTCRFNCYVQGLYVVVNNSNSDQFISKSQNMNIVKICKNN